MRIRPELLVLLLITACGGGGAKSYARLAGSLNVPAALPQLVGSVAQAEPFRESGRVDGMRVLRMVASRDRRLALAVEGEVDACLHSLDSGRCGAALDVVAGEVVDVILSGKGRFAVRLDGDGAGAGAGIPEEYWAADEF